MGSVYKILLPSLRGTVKKGLFNRAAACYLLMIAIGGAIIGALMLGPAGSLLGCVVGLTVGGRYLTAERYFRP